MPSAWKPPQFEIAALKEEPNIPAPELFQSLYDTEILASSARNTVYCIPTVAQCAVHLELLQALHALRVRVMDSPALDHVLGAKNVKKTATGRRMATQEDAKLLKKGVNKCGLLSTWPPSVSSRKFKESTPSLPASKILRETVKDRCRMWRHCCCPL